MPKFDSKTDQKLKLPLQRLTSAQMEERRKLGLCYNCDEKWQMGHRCKGAKLFLLKGCDMEIEQKSGVQLVELEDDRVMLGHQEAVQASENIIAPTEITLYALVGSPSSQTMRVRVRIKNEDVVSLIDFGSTHNFLNVIDLDNLRLSLDTSQILEVKVVNGSIVKTLGVCHRVTLFIQGNKFVLDLNVLHFGGGGGWGRGCAVVLGTQWLSTLGAIIWDFKLLTMRFCYLGKEVFLQSLHLSPLTFSEVDKLFTNSAKKGLVLQITAINITSPSQPLLPTALSALLDKFS